MIKDPFPWSEPRRGNEVELLVAGDFNIQRRSDPLSALANVRRTLEAADLRYVNMEGLYGDPDIQPIDGKPKWRHSDPGMFAGLEASGIDVVGLANNVNYGRDELAATIARLDGAGILHCGAGPDLEAAHAPAIVELRGVRIGFLQYTARYYGDYPIAGADAPGVARVDAEIPEDFDRLRHDVASLRTRVDACVVSHHVRLSNHREVEEYQRTFARTAAEAGADLVFGHGAHLNQEVDRAGATPVFHCVGQFVFDYPPSRAKTDGIVLRLLVSKEGVRDLSFALAWRDEENNAGLVPHSSEPGRRQLAELREMSPGVTIRERGEELVLEEA